MSVLGVSFRNTSGFVADGAGDTYDLGPVYPVTRGGLTFGWSTDMTSTSRDRSGYTAKMAGLNQIANSGATVDWTLDLPNGAGTYDVRIALGDELNAQNCHAVIKDTSTTKLTLNGTTGGAGGGASTFIDAANTAYAETSWIASNTAASIVFATSKLVVTLGGFAGGAGNSAIAYISVLQTAGGSPTLAQLERREGRGSFRGQL